MCSILEESKLQSESVLENENAVFHAIPWVQYVCLCSYFSNINIETIHPYKQSTGLFRVNLFLTLVHNSKC